MGSQNSDCAGDAGEELDDADAAGGHDEGEKLEEENVELDFSEEEALSADEADMPKAKAKATAEAPMDAGSRATEENAMSEEDECKDAARPSRIQARQKGVSNIRWDPTQAHFKLRWQEDGARKSKCFSRSKHMAPGKTVQQADDRALRSATTYRNKLVRQGLILERRRSGATGVHWRRDRKYWEVRGVRHRVKNPKEDEGQQRSFTFRPLRNTPKEVEKARLLAVAKRQELTEHITPPRARWRSIAVSSPVFF